MLNQELKHNIKDTVKKNVNVSVKPQSPEELEELLDKMTPEQIQALKSKLAPVSYTHLIISILKNNADNPYGSR